MFTIFLAMVMIGSPSDFARTVPSPVRVLAFIILLFLSLNSCGNHRTENDSSIPEKHFKPLEATKEKEDLSDCITDIELVQINSDGVVFSGMTKLVVGDVRFYLVSGGVVYSASKDGKDVQRIGHLGRGAGEYLSIKDITLNPSQKELWCLDVNNAVLRYDCSNGGFLGKVDPGPTIGYVRAIFPVSEDSFALFSPNPLDDGASHESFHCLRYYNLDSKELGKKMKWERFNADLGFSIPVTRNGLQFILAPTTFSPAIVFQNGNEMEHVIFDFGRKGVPDNYFSKDVHEAWRNVSALFDADCYKCVSAIYFLGDKVYFQAFGKESSVWNFLMDIEGAKGIRWPSIGGAAPPVSALSSDGGYLFFPYCDYGHASLEEEKDPLKRYVLQKFGRPCDKDASYIVKVKMHVE